MTRVKQALSKTDEANLLLLAFECSTVSDGWQRFLALIETTLGCRTFLCEFDANGSATSMFADHRPGQELGNVMAQIETDGGRNALEFLLSEASLNFPYCKIALDKSNSSRMLQTGKNTAAACDDQPASEAPLVAAAPDATTPLRHAPGLVSPLNRTDQSTILFACLFVGRSPDEIDVSLANDVFLGVLRLVKPALDLHLKLKKERADSEIFQTLLSSLDSPVILVNQGREILAQTPAGLDALRQLNAVRKQGGSLVFHNPQIEAGFRFLMERYFAEEATPDTEWSTSIEPKTPPVHSICLTGPNGLLMRIALEIVSPRVRGSHSIASPWFLVRVYETSDPSRDVEAVLQEQYDLSQSEARLSRQLTISGSMHETVTRLGITRNTAKTHLRRIFEKTGVNTQLQLARLVHRLSGLF